MFLIAAIQCMSVAAEKKPDRILDEEDEATLAAIDRGIKAADEGRVVSSEEARWRLRL
jgi:predicted transcriptional regulator